MQRRIIGAAVLASLAVIFLPGLLEKPNIQPITPMYPSFNVPKRPIPKQVPNLKIEPVTQAISQKPQIIVSTVPKPISIEKPQISKQPQTALEKAPETPKLSAWIVQLGNYSNHKIARNWQKILRKNKFAAFLEPIEINGKKMLRLQVGPVLEKSEGERIMRVIKKRFVINGEVLRYPN